MMTMIRGGSADTEAKAETVRRGVCSPARTVTMVTPAGKWRSARRNSSDDINGLSLRKHQNQSNGTPLALPVVQRKPAEGTPRQEWRIYEQDQEECEIGSQPEGASGLLHRPALG